MSNFRSYWSIIERGQQFEKISLTKKLEDVEHQPAVCLQGGDSLRFYRQWYSSGYGAGRGYLIQNTKFNVNGSEYCYKATGVGVLD